MEKELEEIKNLLQVILDNQEKIVAPCNNEGFHKGMVALPTTFTSHYSLRLSNGFAEIQLSKIDNTTLCEYEA